MEQKPKGKKIQPLSFESWNRYTRHNKELFQVLSGSCGLSISGNRKPNINSRIDATFCPLCGEKLKIIDVSPHNDVRDEGWVWQHYHLCEDCGFWKCVHSSSVSSDEYEIPFVKRFNYELDVPSISHLSNEIHKNPARISTMNSKKFELFIGSILADYMDCEVYHVGQSGDDGIDLVAILSDNPMLIQVKRRENQDKAESINIVKLLFASAFAKGAKSGMVVTSAKKFSRQAYQWVESPTIKDFGFSLNLISLPSLLSMIGAVAKSNEAKPWEKHFEINKREHREYMRSVSSSKVTSKIINFVDGDLFVSFEDKKQSKLYLFEHADLTKCYVTESSNQNNFESFENRNFADLKKNISLNHNLNILYDNKAIHLLNCLPNSGAYPLLERWTRLYPKDVFIFNI